MPLRSQNVTQSDVDLESSHSPMVATASHEQSSESPMGLTDNGSSHCVDMLTPVPLTKEKNAYELSLQVNDELNEKMVDQNSELQMTFGSPFKPERAALVAKASPCIKHENSILLLSRSRQVEQGENAATRDDTHRMSIPFN